MKKISLFLLALFLILTLKTTSAKAVAESNSNQESSTTEEVTTEENSQEKETTTQNIKDRLKKALEENNEKIKSSIDDLTKTKRGFIGQVLRVSEETITITNNKGTTIIPLDETIKIIKSGSEIQADKLAVENWLTILGYVEEDDTFLPKKIIVSTTSLAPKEHIVELGAVIKIDGQKMVFKPRSSDANKNYKLNTQTSYLDNTGEKANSKNFTEDTQCLLIGYQNKDEAIVTVLKAIAPF